MKRTGQNSMKRYHLAHFVGYFDLDKRIDLGFLLWNEAWLFPSDGNFNISNKVFQGEEFDLQGFTLCVQIFLTNGRKNDKIHISCKYYDVWVTNMCRYVRNCWSYQAYHETQKYAHGSSIVQLRGVLMVDLILIMHSYLPQCQWSYCEQYV